MAVYKNSVPFGNIVTDGLVLNLDATNINSYPGSGTTWIDTSFYRNNGTLTNGPTFLRERGRGSIVFDGTDDYVDFGSIQILQFSNNSSYTLSSWIKWTPSGSNFYVPISYGRVSGSSPNTGDQGYYIGLDSGILRSNSFLFDYYDGTNSIGIQGNINTVPTGSWINITGTNDGINNATGLKVYINGVLASSTVRNNQVTSTINYTSCSFNIAARDKKANFYGSYSISHVYNRALSAQEVQQNFNALKSRFGL